MTEEQKKELFYLLDTLETIVEDTDQTVEFECIVTNNYYGKKEKNLSLLQKAYDEVSSMHYIFHERYLFEMERLGGVVENLRAFYEKVK